MSVDLDTGIAPLWVKTDQRVSCGSSDPELDNIELKFEKPKATIFKYTAETKIWINSELQIQEYQLPYRSGQLTLEKSANRKRVRVTLKPQPIQDGSRVSCIVASEGKKGKVGKNATTLQVRWRPSVREVAVSDASGRSNDVAEGREATVRCEAQLGLPAVPGSSVRARIGNRELSHAKIGPPRPDSEGFPWRELQWTMTLTRAENGSRLECRVQNSSARAQVAVRYPPRRDDITFRPQNEATLSVGETVTCSAKGNPTPQVTLQLDPKRHSAVTWARRSDGRGSVKIPNDASERNYTFLCKAENSEGGAEMNTTISVRKVSLLTNLVLPDHWIKVGSTFEIRCGPQTTNVSLSSAKISFLREGPAAAERSDVHVTHPKGRPINNTDFSAFGGERQRFENASQSLIVTLKASPKHLGRVRCRIESVRR